MKKLFEIMTTLFIFAAPIAIYAQAGSIAGSLQIGVHLDASYQWSGSSKRDSRLNYKYTEIRWPGYDSVNIGDVALELNGKVGERISFKVLEALVMDGTSVIVPDFTLVGAGSTLLIRHKPAVGAKTLEAYVDIKIMEPLKFRVGKQLTPTLLANTGIHQANVFRSANAPLIANRAVGTNQLRVGSNIPVKADAPDFVTGAAIIGSFSGAEISYTWFDGWLKQGSFVNADDFSINVGDVDYDFNKTKGANIALGYSGHVGPGKIAARAFYFDELSETAASTPKLRTQGWGLGASYTHAKFFIAAEYANDTLSLDKNLIPSPGKNDNNWWGFYLTLAGKFSGIEPLYRLDYVNYTNWNDNAVADITSYDTETWHTIGVNYWFNDNALVGLDYVIKAPEMGKLYKYPNINELIIYLEVNTL